MAEPSLIALLTVGGASLWLGRRHLPRSARAVLTVVALYFGIKGTLYASVRRIADTDTRLSHAAPRAIEARWGSWTTWNIFEKDPQVLRAWQVDAWTGSLGLSSRGPFSLSRPWLPCRGRSTQSATS